MESARWSASSSPPLIATSCAARAPCGRDRAARRHRSRRARCCRRRARTRAGSTAPGPADPPDRSRCTRTEIVGRLVLSSVPNIVTDARRDMTDVGEGASYASWYAADLGAARTHRDALDPTPGRDAEPGAEVRERVRAAFVGNLDGVVRRARALVVIDARQVELPTVAIVGEPHPVPGDVNHLLERPSEDARRSPAPRGVRDPEAVRRAVARVGLPVIGGLAETEGTRLRS